MSLDGIQGHRAAGDCIDSLIASQVENHWSASRIDICAFVEGVSEKRTKGESMKKGILVLIVLDLSLLISPFGAKDLLVPWTKVAAQKSYAAAINMGHTSVLAVKSVVERTTSKIL